MSIRRTRTPQQSDAIPANLYFVRDYCGHGPRVILLVGTAWRPAMRAHYGIGTSAFFSRTAHPQEPSFYPNRHPWGWVFTPANSLKYESHWLAPDELDQLRRTLDEQLAGPAVHNPEIAEALAA